MNRGFEYRETVGNTGHGVGLLDYLSARYRHSRREVCRRLQPGL